MMKKDYEKPYLTVINLNVPDVLATSIDGDDDFGEDWEDDE